MQKLNEMTQKNLKKMKQLEHRRQLARYAEQKREKKRHDALAHQIGEVVLSCWPWTAKLQPYRRKEDQDTEFAALRKLLLQATSTIHCSTFNLSPSSHLQIDGSKE